MTTAIATTAWLPRGAARLASRKVFMAGTAILLLASLMLNGYYYVAVGTINDDLVEAGVVQAPAALSLEDRLGVTMVGDNVTFLAISAAEAAAAAQQLQQAMIQMQSAAAAAATAP